MGFFLLFIKIKFKNWRVTFLIFFFFIIKINWDGLPVYTQETIYHVHTEMRQSLDRNVLNLSLGSTKNATISPNLGTTGREDHYRNRSDYQAARTAPPSDFLSGLPNYRIGFLPDPLCCSIDFPYSFVDFPVDFLDNPVDYPTCFLDNPVDYPVGFRICRSACRNNRIDDPSDFPVYTFA